MTPECGYVNGRCQLGVNDFAEIADEAEFSYGIASRGVSHIATTQFCQTSRLEAIAFPD